MKARLCIFCGGRLDGKTKPEHILHDALGGKKTTRRVVCSICNNRFGGSIDKALAEQFSVIRTLLQLRSGTGALPPILKRVAAGNEKIDIRERGRLKLVSKPFEITKDDLGRTQLRILGESLEEREAMVPHMAAALKISEERLRQLLSESTGSSVERRPDPIRLDLPRFGGLSVIRSAAKSCLVLWATLVGNNEVERVEYDPVRRFIDGKNDQFLQQSADLDSRFHNDEERIKSQFGPIFNLIYVKSDETGHVIGHFTIYNLIAFQITLCDGGGAPDQRIALVSDPLTRKWSDRLAAEIDVSFDWLRTPDFDYEDMQRSRQKMGAIMDLHLEMSRKEEFRRIIEDVLKRHGLREGDPIPKELAYSLSREMSTRITHSVFNRPYLQSITPDQMEKMFGKKGRT